MAAVAQSNFHKLRKGDRVGGKYVLRRRVAVGGMGEIWVAHNDMTEAEVALKVMRGDIDARLRVEPRFRHEAKLGATLSHRNIIRVFDLIEERDGALILVMELLRGETVLRLLRRRKELPMIEAIAILLPILAALRHAHDMGVVHRDVKPANIYLAVDPDGHVTPKLIDFGIAKLPGGVHTVDDRILGTPRYMSPEQIRADANLDGRSDIFSAGVLLVEMLTGASPFECATPTASLAAVLENRVDPDPRIDPRLWLVVQRALAKRAYERFANAGDFAAALRDVVGETDASLATCLQRRRPPPSLASMRVALGIGPDEPLPEAADDASPTSSDPYEEYDEYDDDESSDSIDSIAVESPRAPVAPMASPGARSRGRGALVAVGAIAAGLSLTLGTVLVLRRSAASHVAPVSVEHAPAPSPAPSSSPAASAPSSADSASLAPPPSAAPAVADPQPPASAGNAPATAAEAPHRSGTAPAPPRPAPGAPAPARKPVARNPGF